MGTQENFRASKRVLEEFSKVLYDSGICDAYPIVKAAIHREVNMLRLCASQPADVRNEEDVAVIALADFEAQQQFLSRIESIPICERASPKTLSCRC